MKMEFRLGRAMARLSWICMLVTLFSFALGCGGAGNGSTNTPAATSNSMVQLRIGDAPVDRVIAFEVSIASPIVLHPASGGSAVSVTVPSNRLELSHMSAATEPLAIFNVPQGSYTSIDLTITNPEVTYVDNAGQPHHLQSNASTPVTISLSPALTVGSGAGVVAIDVSLANALSFDAQGNVTGFNFSGTSFTITTKPVGAENEQEDEDGEIEDVTGMVTNVSGTTFTLTLGQMGASLTFNTDTNTEFNDGASLATLLNTIVKVEGFTRPDGTLYAKEVEGIEDHNGAEIEGLITQVTGNPATALTIVAQDGIGGGMDNSKIGATFNVDVSNVQANKYRVSQGHIDGSGLNIGGVLFPFDPTTIHAGQRVEVESVAAVPPASGTFVAEKVKLQQQAITGKVTAVSSSSMPRTITITAAADSAFAILSGGGTPTITVYDQTKTDHRMSNVAVGDTIRVRGLLFFTGSQFNMVARRITQ